MSDSRQHRDSVDDRPTIEQQPADRRDDAAARDTDRHTDREIDRRTDVRHVREPDRARGGFSFWSILSGVLVAFGAFIILAAIVGAIFAALGLTEGGISSADARNAGIGAIIAVIIAQFLAYLWGGYTAGRMARGSGVLNGLLVPLMAIILVVVVGGIVAALMANAGAEPPDAAAAMPLPLSEVGELATGAGIGALIAMFLGGALGGMMGARWHTKLEDREAVVDVR